MGDPAQTALFLIIIALTVLLLVLGFQVFFILRELRETVSKANRVLDDTGVITRSVSAPISSLSSLAMGLKAGSSFLNILRNKKKTSKEKHNGK